MADEGIMALPQGMGMQDEQPQGQQPTVTSADSYDAAQTALGRVNPGEQAALKEALRQNIGNLQLTPQQLDALIQVFEYVSQHPGDYVNLLQKMLEAGVLDEGDMPPEYDPEFIGAMLAVLHEMQQMQAAGAQEPMDLSPVVQGLQPMGMASGGLADIGQYLASKGRGGDSMLAHINPEEAAMLKRRGGSGTINPNTGLPEFKEGALGGVFDAIGGALKGVANVAKDLLKSPVGRILGTIALATVLGPTAIGASLGSAGTAALASGTVALAGGGSMKEALISGAMGYIGGGGTVMGVNPVEAVGRYLPGAAGTGIGAAGGALNTGLATGLVGAGIGKLGGMSTEDALKMGLTSGVSAGGMKAFGGMSPEDYAQSTEVFKRAMDGDAVASDVYGRGNLAEIKAYLANNPTSNLANAPAQPSLFQNQGTQPTPVPGQVPGQASFPGAGAETGPTDFYTKLAPNELSNSPYQSSLRRLPATPVTEPPGFFDKALTGAENIYDTYLSPDRPLPPDAGFFRKYGPLAAAGTAAVAAFGGMDSSPAEIDPITAGERARYEESRLRAKARRERMANYGLEGNRPIAPLIYAADGGIVTARKVRHLYDGGDAAGYGYGEGEGAAQGSGMGGYGSSGTGEGLGRGIGPGYEAMALGNYATNTDYDAQDRSYMNANAANNALTAQENNMRDAQNLAASSQFVRDRDAQYAAQDNATNPGGSFGNAGIGYNTFSEGADGRAKGGYIGRFSEGGDAGERRRLAQERRRGYGLEGNLLDTALDQARTGNAARSFDEYFVNNSGDQRGPGTDNTGDGQTFYGGLGNLAAEAQRAGFPTIGGFLASGIPVGAAYKGGNFNTAGLAALGSPSAIAAMNSQNQRAVQDAEQQSSASPFGPTGPDAPPGGGDTPEGDRGNVGSGSGYMAKGGPAKMTQFPRRDGPINGPGTGTSDDIPAMLSDGEFVFTAKAVRNAGGGSRRKGAARMYKLMKKLEGGAVKGN